MNLQSEILYNNVIYLRSGTSQSRTGPVKRRLYAHIRQGMPSTSIYKYRANTSPCLLYKSIAVYRFYLLIISASCAASSAPVSSGTYSSISPGWQHKSSQILSIVDKLNFIASLFLIFVIVPAGSIFLFNSLYDVYPLFFKAKRTLHLKHIMYKSPTI